MMVLLVVVMILLLDYLMTMLYCYLRKKSYLKRKDSIQSDIVKDSSNKKIIEYLDGYILYKCNILQYIPSHRVRKFILRTEFQMKIHKTAMIYHGGEFRHPWKIEIGEGVSVGDHVRLDGRNGLIIGSNVNIGSGVWIWTEQHDYNDPLFRCNNKGGMVIIEDRVWLSARTMILPGCKIHEGCVVGAGSIVTKDCESFSLYVGVPARKIANRETALEYNLSGQYLHFY